MQPVIPGFFTVLGLAVLAGHSEINSQRNLDAVGNE
jgi:hypothetical protein